MSLRTLPQRNTALHGEAHLWKRLDRRRTSPMSKEPIQAAYAMVCLSFSQPARKTMFKGRLHLH
jgi:hypothetical protein